VFGAQTQTEQATPLYWCVRAKQRHPDHDKRNVATGAVLWTVNTQKGSLPNEKPLQHNNYEDGNNNNDGVDDNNKNINNNSSKRKYKTEKTTTTSTTTAKQQARAPSQHHVKRCALHTQRTHPRGWGGRRHRCRQLYSIPTCLFLV
jgi:hypothetical protein